MKFDAMADKPSSLLFLPGALGRTEFWLDQPSALISPVQAGERLASVLPLAELHVIPGGEHDVAAIHADPVAPLIDRHLSGALASFSS
jgi:hypothetical protein